MSAQNIGTLESLREALKQTLEEKQRTEQKFAEDKQRLDQKIEEIKKAISGFIAELQSLDNTLQASQPDTVAGHLRRTTVDYKQIHTVGTPIKVPATVEIPIGKIAAYIVGTILLFIVLFFAMSAVSKLKSRGCIELSHQFFSLAASSLMPSAEACLLSDRWQERRQERLSTAASVAATDNPAEQEVVPLESSNNEQATVSHGQLRPRQKMTRFFQRLFVRQGSL